MGFSLRPEPGRGGKELEEVPSGCGGQPGASLALCCHLAPYHLDMLWLHLSVRVACEVERFLDPVVSLFFWNSALPCSLGKRIFTPWCAEKSKLNLAASCIYLRESRFLEWISISPSMLWTIQCRFLEVGYPCVSLSSGFLEIVVFVTLLAPCWMKMEFSEGKKKPRNSMASLNYALQF